MLRLQTIFLLASVWGKYQGPDMSKPEHASKAGQPFITHHMDLEFSIQVPESFTNSTEPEFKEMGGIKIGLLGYASPMSVRNVCVIANGIKTKGLNGPVDISYTGTKIYEILPRVWMNFGQVGEYPHDWTIYGKGFKREEYMPKFGLAGMVLLAKDETYGANTSRLRILTETNKYSDVAKDHTAVGRVIEGMDLVRNFGTMPVGKFLYEPLLNVVITKSSCTYLYADDQDDESTAAKTPKAEKTKLSKKEKKKLKKKENSKKAKADGIEANLMESLNVQMKIAN